jgi:TetR/AcrR family transcriptional repressor of mexJK operon
MVRAASPPRSRILLAAKELFFSQGFARVSTDDLAQAASVSKATLYRHFEGLNGVLRAVVEAEVESFEQGVPTDVETEEEFVEALISFGSKLLRFLNQPEIIRFSQLMFEEARSHRDLAGDFYSCAYGRTQDDLSRLIQQGIDLGYLRSEHSASDLAEQLLGLWEGFGFVRALLGLASKPYENPEERSRSFVHILLHGHAGNPSLLDRTVIPEHKP